MDSVLPWGAIRASVVVLAIVAALTAIIVSPLVFGVLARHTTGWTDMANIGQAYGGVAAVLSGLALGVVGLKDVCTCGAISGLCSRGK